MLYSQRGISWIEASTVAALSFGWISADPGIYVPPMSSSRGSVGSLT